MTEPTRFELEQPVEHNGKTYDHLTLREAEMGDLCAMDLVEGETTKFCALLASISGVPLPAVLKIKAREMLRLQTAAQGIMGNLPSAGGEAEESREPGAS